jgi:hypothetical protein
MFGLADGAQNAASLTFQYPPLSVQSVVEIVLASSFLTTDTLRSLRLERSGRCIRSFGVCAVPQVKHLFTAEMQRAQRD